MFEFNSLSMNNLYNAVRIFIYHWGVKSSIAALYYLHGWYVRT